MNCNTAKTDCASSSAGNLFCQLRQLAVQVESGVESLQTDLASNRVRDRDIVENTKAVNFLLHTKKDIVELRSKVINSLIEFSQENAKIDKISELMNDVLTVNSERLERVESHFQIYGYEKPVAASKTSTENHVAAAGTGRGGSSDVKSVAYEDSKDRDVSELAYDMNDACPNTPTDTCEKPVDCNVMRTPKLEDLYNNLSEEMISIIKQAGRNTLHNDASLKQNTTLKAYTNNTLVIKTPEPPVLLSGMFTLNDKSQFSSLKGKSQFSSLNDKSQFSSLNDKSQFSSLNDSSQFLSWNDSSQFSSKNDSDQFSSLKSHNSTPTTPGMNVSHFSRKDTFGTGRIDRQMTDVSVCHVKAPVRTPQMPTLLMSRFHTRPALNVPQADTEKSAKSFFQTPPAPELKMCQFRNNDLAQCLNDVNKKVHTSQTTDLSTPEAPRLFSMASMLTPEAPKLYSATGLSTPEVPKLLTRSLHFNQ